MPSDRRRNCRRCGKHDSEVGAISWDGYCFPCGRIEYDANVHQLHAHSGPAFKRWRQACIAALGAVPQEDVKA